MSEVERTADVVIVSEVDRTAAVVRLAERG